MSTVRDDAGDLGQPSDVAWLEPVAEHSLRAVVPDFMPPTAAAVYARWWQLETWLRELAYVELRAMHGEAWVAAVRAATARQTKDASFTHMTSSDSDNPLAYLDYRQLLQVIDEHWDEFGHALLEQKSWEGRQTELVQIRHRIAHLRSPHVEDLNRLELTLRDLEHGTFKALASYNDKEFPDERIHRDPVTTGWIRRSHRVARSLIDHAARKYDARLLVRYSRRPWAPEATDLEHTRGIVWHADFMLGSSQFVDIADIWHDSALDGLRPLLLHLLGDSPGHIRFTFSAADDPDRLADAIGEAFDAVLGASRGSEVDYAEWVRRARTLDYRVMVGKGWNLIEKHMRPTSYFGADRPPDAAPYL